MEETIPCDVSQNETEALREELEKLKQNLQCLTEENGKLIAETEKLEKTVKRMQSSADKSDAYLGQLVALKNDFESYKRRMKFSAENSKSEGVAEVAAKLIPIVDTFDIAKQHLADENLKAFEMVCDQFVRVLAEIGVTEIEVEGKGFDHMTMNALSSIDRGEENKGKVVEIYKKGYMFGEKVLRYAEVIVGA